MKTSLLSRILQEKVRVGDGLSKKVFQEIGKEILHPEELQNFKPWRSQQRTTWSFKSFLDGMNNFLLLLVGGIVQDWVVVIQDCKRFALRWLL